MKNILEDGQNTISNDVENQNISPNGESPHSEIRKKELVKNRKLNIINHPKQKIFLVI